VTNALAYYTNVLITGFKNLQYRPLLLKKVYLILFTNIIYNYKKAYNSRTPLFIQVSSSSLHVNNNISVAKGFIEQALAPASGWLFNRGIYSNSKVYCSGPCSCRLLVLAYTMLWYVQL
jgi:hypothetical protein